MSPDCVGVKETEADSPFSASLSTLSDETEKLCSVEPSFLRVTVTF